MDINGPVAMAGSIFQFSSVMGTRVPKMEANMTTANRLNGYRISHGGTCPETDKIIDVYQHRNDGGIDYGHY